MNTTTITLNAVLSLLAMATVAVTYLVAHRLHADRARETDAGRWADPLPLSLAGERTDGGELYGEDYAEAA